MSRVRFKSLNKWMANGLGVGYISINTEVLKKGGGEARQEEGEEGSMVIIDRQQISQWEARRVLGRRKKK